MSCTHDCGCSQAVKDARTDDWGQIAPESARGGCMADFEAQEAPGPRPVGMEVRHLDGSRDACATNLAYGTHAENMQDMVRHGVRRHPLRTECRKGHSLDGDNAYEHRGRLHCRTCRHEQYLSRVGRSQ